MSLNHYLYLDPDEITFHLWQSNHPESHHPLDDKRFFDFVLTVVHYKSYRAKWTGSYFEKRCLEAGMHDTAFIHKLSYFLDISIEMHHLQPQPLKKRQISIGEEKGYIYECHFIDEDGRYNFIDITAEEFKRGISKKEAKRHCTKRK